MYEILYPGYAMWQPCTKEQYENPQQGATTRVRGMVEQVGGTHYAGAYQHWDFVVDTRMGYLEGCASKYIIRYRHKGGNEDLDKALSYIDKMVELVKEGKLHPPLDRLDPLMLARLIHRMGRIYKLGQWQNMALRLLATWQDLPDLLASRDFVVELYGKHENGA